EIGYDQVQNFVNELAKEVAVKTLHNVIICLRVMLVGKKGASAVKRGFLRHDPTRGVEAPTKDQKQVVPPTPEEVWNLIDAGEEIGGPGRDMIFIRRHPQMGMADWAAKVSKVEPPRGGRGSRPGT